MSMKGSLYRERDYAFGQAILSLRMSIGLTQAGLAKHLGVSRKAVGEWEAGLTYPKTERLKALIALATQQQAFPGGREEEAIRAFWRAAHQKELLDEAWLGTLLLPSAMASPLSESVEETTDATPALVPPVGELRVDWGNALAVTTFYGREWEMNLLASWVVKERCRVVSVLGLGGIGKSALATRVMQQVAGHFEVVIWRSLRDAPGCEALLDECLQVLAPQALRDVSISLERRLVVLLEHLRRTRVLLVLDNLEALLEEGQSTGRMQTGYEGYARLLRQVAETEHHSCLLLTSREKPSDLVPLEGNRAPVRVLRLGRLDVDSCQQLLVEKEVVGSAADQVRLIEAYAGNPLALRIVAQTIVDLFAGQIAPFLSQGEVVFGGVRELLGEQYARLSSVEQSVLLWLAILREPVSMEELLTVMGGSQTRTRVLEAVDSLRRRSLIEPGQIQGSFTLQSVVLEYVTARLISEVTEEIEQRRPVRLIEHGLELATAKEYVRQTQRRLIVTPLLAGLRSAYPARAAVEEHLLTLLNPLREWADDAQGYGPANLLALLHEQRGHLRGLDLSQLVIRRAFLQGVEMQDTTLARATLRDTIFSRAFDTTWAVAISSTGLYWAVGSGQGKVQVWREEGKILHLAWQAHGGTVWSLAFSPDEGRLATGSWDGSIKLWDSESGTLLWTNWHTNNDIHCLAFAPDGRTLASGGDDATIRLWDAESGTHLQTLVGHGGPVHALAWSPDGSLLANGSFDGSIRLWERPWAQADPPVQVLVGHSYWVTGLAFAPDGRTLGSSSFDGTIKLWDVDSLVLHQTLSGHTDPVLAIAWRPDGRLLASSSFDHTIWLWDVEHLSSRMVLHGHTAAVYDIAFTPDNRSLLSGSDDGTVRMWEVERGECVLIMQGYAASLYDVAWSPDGTRLASAGSDTLVTTWDVAGRMPPRVLRGHFWIVLGVAWSPDGRLLASSGWDNTLRIWDATTGTALQILQEPDHADNGFQCVAWSPDGKFLASGSYLWGVHVWEVRTGILRWIGREQSTRIRRVAWSPDGTRLASCGDDGSVFLWDTSDGTLQASLRGHRGMVMSVAWSPDGTRLVSGGGSRGSGEVAVWEVQSGERLQSWSEPGSLVYALAWSSTGGLLLSGGSDGMLRWWDVERGECLRVLKGHQGTVQSLKVSPDGKRLASSGDDNAIHVWDLQSGEHLQTLRRDRPYERLNINGIKGLSEAQKATLRALGAIESVL
jgi:WD40 repeat protein/transcriptional regulator with XRE-family HTH domain